MPTLADLEPLLTSPREEMSVELKGWLDLSTNEHRATLAKAAIALINHGGGFIVLGMNEVGGAFHSAPRPAAVPEITQDAVNAAIQRYAEPAFHVELHQVANPATGVVHPIVAIPGR